MTELRASLQAQLVAWQVRAGDVVPILEAMKMEHALLAPADCTVSELRFAAAEAVSERDLLWVADQATAAAPTQPQSAVHKQTTAPDGDGDGTAHPDTW